MNKYGILAALHARPCKKAKVIGIFDPFKDEEGRAAHVNGEVAKAIFARAEELLVTPPQIQTVDPLAEKPYGRGL